VEDQAEFVADQRSQIDQLLNIVLVLLVLSILIAVLGIVNTLRCPVGRTDPRARTAPSRGPAATPAARDDPIESVVIAPVRRRARGRRRTGFGWALVRPLREQGITEFVLPVGQLAAVLLVAGSPGCSPRPCPLAGPPGWTSCRRWPRREARVRHWPGGAPTDVPTEEP
jgi:putative ABC transport system permease protein